MPSQLQAYVYLGAHILVSCVLKIPQNAAGGGLLTAVPPSPSLPPSAIVPNYTVDPHHKCHKTKLAWNEHSNPSGFQSRASAMKIFIPDCLSWHSIF